MISVRYLVDFSFGMPLPGCKSRLLQKALVNFIIHVFVFHWEVVMTGRILGINFPSLSALSHLVIYARGWSFWMKGGLVIPLPGASLCLGSSILMSTGQATLGIPNC